MRMALMPELNLFAQQVVLPPEELKTSLKTHNSVVIHRASVSSDQHSDREDDDEDDDGRGDTMYISSSYPCIESESEVRCPPPKDHTASLFSVSLEC
jgi:hypothetical protein